MKKIEAKKYDDVNLYRRINGRRNNKLSSKSHQNEPKTVNNVRAKVKLKNNKH